MKPRIIFDVYLFHTGFPKLIVDFGVFRQDYHFEHYTLHVFLCTIVDIIVWMLTILLFVSFYLSQLQEKNATNSTAFFVIASICQCVVVCPSTVTVINIHTSSDVVWMCDSTFNQTSSDILPRHMTESESESRPWADDSMNQEGRS